MARILVDSLDDLRLQPYRDLRYQATSRQGDRFIAEGRLVVERLIASDYECESVLVEAGRHARLIDSLAQAVDVLVVDPEAMRQLVGFDFHRGLLACGRRRPPQPIRALASPARGAAPLMFCCGVTDPENLGSLIRSSVALGVERMVITPDSADPFSRRVLRVSMAAALKLDFYLSVEPAVDLAELAERVGYRTVATALVPGAVPLETFVHGESFLHDARPLAIVVGSEAHGLSEKVLRSATDCVTIPMHRGTDSLNVAVAGGIVLYVLTQHSASRAPGR